MDTHKNSLKNYKIMLSEKALNKVDQFLSHERDALSRVLTSVRGIDNIIVIGSGDYRYLDLARLFNKKYVAIDPTLGYMDHYQHYIIQYQAFFEEIERSDLFKGNCLFVFWFNVYAYISNREEKLRDILRPGDYLFISQWADTGKANALRDRYFKCVNEEYNAQVIGRTDKAFALNSIPYTNLKKSMIFETNINTITVCSVEFPTFSKLRRKKSVSKPYL